MGNSCYTQTKLSNEFNIIQGEFLLQNFQFIKVLYRTRMARVSLVFSQKEKSFHVLKASRKVELCQHKRVGLPINQQLILSQLYSPFIVNMLQSFQDKENLYLLLEYMSNGSLREYLKDNGSMSQQQTRFLAICLLFSLDYLRRKNIVHFDIKPGNILIDQKSYFRLCDFNLSKKIVEGSRVSYHGRGTFNYQAPEMLDGSATTSFQSDYYSLGLTLFECITGLNARKVVEMDGNKIEEFLSRNNISNNCIDFISGLLQQNPKSRLGSNRFAQMWAHPWIALDASQKGKYYQKNIDSPLFQTSNSFNDKLQYPASTIETSRKDFNEQNQGDDMLADLMIKNPKFQKMFVQFKTIKR